MRLLDDAKGPKPFCIHADANYVGNIATQLVPRFAELLASVSECALDYPHPDTDGFISAVAEFTGAPATTIFPSGSGLKELDRTVTRFSPSEVVYLGDDFRGYPMVAALHGVKLVPVATRRGDEESIYRDLANAVRGLYRPLVMLTPGPRNPGQGHLDPWRAVAAIHDANPNAIIVFSSAYWDYSGFEQRALTEIPLTQPRTIILAPTSKILYTAGVATSWMIIGDPELQRRIREKALPFEVSGQGSRLIPKLLANLDIVETVRGHVVEARDLLQQGFANIFGAENVVRGAGPYALVHGGASTAPLVRGLHDLGIFVQQQAGGNMQFDEAWFRVSATRLEDARIILGASRELLTRIR